MLKVMAFIDGYNLYAGLMKRAQFLRWCNYWKLSEQFLRSDEILSKVIYFTAKDEENRPKSKETRRRHERFIREQKAAGVEVVFGRLKVYDTDWPRLDQRKQEKQTDINLALRMYMEAEAGNYDRAILVSADTDFIPVVKQVKDMGKEVIFDAEHLFDGYKDDPEFAMNVLSAAAGAGADFLALCDTNGGCLPHEIYEITKTVTENFKVNVGIHAHNDCGMADANSIEAVRAGAVQVQGTINGYGERCGNANLTTIMPTLKLKLGAKCGGRRKLKNLCGLSQFTNDLINMRQYPRAPYVGRSAFSHKGGAHVNAVQKNPATFEHIDPAKVGNERHILVSELSGGSNVLLKAIEMGLGKDSTSKEGCSRILKELKSLENKGYAFESADASFKILVQKVLKKHKPFFELEGFRVTVEKAGKDAACVSEATVKINVNGVEEHTVAEGDGPINALDGALRKALKGFYPEITNVHLADYRVRILDPEEATAATTRVQIESSDGKENWGTVGVSENIIEASWEALVDSVEYKLFREEKQKS